MRPTLIALARSFCARIQVKTYPFSLILAKNMANSGYQTVVAFAIPSVRKRIKFDPPL